MQYRIDPKSGNSLSVLGFGCMRFPRRLGQIDVTRTEKLILDAIESGINYFDTAYIYMGSEEVLGGILHKNNVRDKIFLATKLPLGKCKKTEDFDRFFAEQLERLKTDRIDYYFMHNLTDMAGWERLCALGIKEWIAAKKREGKIKQLGFSFHGSQSEFFTLIDAYDWDFCQIQYNYVNIRYQAGEAGLKKAAEKGLPVIIMEPLLGGKLATGLPKKAVDIFKEADASVSPASWALKWLWNQPEVTVVLSGMNDGNQLSENLKTAATAVEGMLSEKENAVFTPVIEAFNASYKVPCTGCNYCMPCPHGVSIPACFAAYNMSFSAGMASGMQQYITSAGAANADKHHGASMCTKCGKCEKQCPQHIPIIKSLEDVKKKMEPFWFKWAIAIIKKVMS